MAKAKTPDTNDLLIALRHPLRRRILKVLSGKEPRSPRELAQRLNQPLTSVSYHVRVLAECNAVQLVRTQKVRGATQHFYRSAVKVGWVQSVLRSRGGSQPGRSGKKRSGKKKP